MFYDNVANFMDISIGYQALIEQLNLSVIKHYRKSYISLHGRGHIKINNHYETHVYPNTYALKDPDNPIAQLVFALKYDGVNLEILQAVFNKLEQQVIEQAVKQHQSSKYIRVLWFLYELLTGVIISAPEIKKLKYVDVLDPERYFTAPGIKSVRHRVYNNLLGDQKFCPMIRKTKGLIAYIAEQYDVKAKALADKYEPEIIARASHYLFTKETLSSYAIEREKPNKDRIQRFINILQHAPKIEVLTKQQLLELQNIIVDPRFKDTDYRVNQNYIGENVNYMPRIHYISPRPQDVELLMEGLLATLYKAINNKTHPVISAAMIAFGFVFIHPFEDGNGRIHRFLIHYILSKQQFTLPGIIFPVSAVMLRNMRTYDHILETFSKSLMHLFPDYTLSEDGILVVGEETSSYYKFIDYTLFAEYLFVCIEETLREHFAREMEFLVKYDTTKHKIQTEIDMPDHLIDLFIRCVRQNDGELGKKRREQYFNKLTAQEINKLENIVKTQMLGVEGGN